MINPAVTRLLKRHQIIMASGIVILFVLILTVKMLLPNFHRVSQITGSNRELSQKVAVLRSKDEQLSALSVSIYQDALVKAIGILPGSKDYVSLFTTLDNLQSRTGVSILRTDFQLGIVSTDSAKLKSDKVNGVFTVPISMEILGTISQINFFLNSLTDFSGRLILVDNVQWDISEDRLIKAVVSGKAYFNPQPLTIGEVDSPLPQFTESGEKILAKILEIPKADTGLEDVSDIILGNKTLFY